MTDNRRKRRPNTSDLAALMKAAKESGAVSLKIGDFEVKFTLDEPVLANTTLLPAYSEQEVDLKEADDAKEQRFAELLISDPLAYEAFLTSEGVGNYDA